METSGACLDNNHSHFILVDGGQVNSYGHEIQLRGNVEQAICNMSIEKSTITSYFLILYLTK